MKVLWGVLTILMVGALVGAPATRALAQPDPSLTISITEATHAPVAVPLSLGQPVVVRVDGRIPASVDVTPPGIVHPILRNGEILVVPLTQGQTMLLIGLGGGMTAKLAIAVGDEGVRLITLSVPPSAPHTTQASGPPVAAQSGSDIEVFVASLSETQRQALMGYLRAPSLSALSALVQSLTPAQQQVLVDVLANRDGLESALAHPQSAAPVPAPAMPIHAVTSGTAPVVLGSGTTPGPRPSGPVSPVPASSAGVTISAPAGIAVHVIPTATQGILYLSYVLQNTTTNVVRADPHEIAVTGARGPVTVRQMDAGTPSDIAPGSMETGIIAMATDGGKVTVTWRLRDAAGNPLPVGIIATAP